MAARRTIQAAEFKARCLEILDDLAARKVEQVTVTKRGKPVAVLRPPETEVQPLHGLLRGSVHVPPGVDLTAPALDESLNADAGRIHE